LPPCRPLPAPGSGSRARPPRLRACLGALVASLVLGVGAAHAFQITAIRPTRDSSGHLWVEVQLDEPIEPRVASSLGRGMPATLTLHAELWRRRRGWFDRMERTVEATFRMHYDAWGDDWHLDRPGAPPLELGTLDSLEAALEHTLALPVSPLEKIAPETSCYVVVSASLRPLNVEDVEEVEGWLSGEVKEKRHSGLGVLTGIPRSLFEAARNFAGFGDERSRLISTDFTPANLPPAGH
jgi:hypothetical protein